MNVVLSEDTQEDFFMLLEDAKSYTYIAVVALKKACAEEGFDYHKLFSDLVSEGFFVPSDTIVDETFGFIAEDQQKLPYKPPNKEPPGKPPDYIV